MKQMIAATLKKVGVHRGSPRLYLEGATPARGGFTPGVRFTLERRGEQRALVLRVAHAGERTVSRKEKAGRERPVIDINSAQALEMFAGMDSVRVLVGNGEIWVMPLAVEVRKQARINRLNQELARGQISTAAVAHGAGVLSNALHKGLKDAGLSPKLRWAVEVEEDALDQAMRCNDAWDADTIAVAMPMQQVGLVEDFVRSRLPQVTLLEAGLPCTAASVAGRSKKRLAKAEDDDKAGHLVAGFLAILTQANPAIMLLENVVPYQSTSSAAILRTQLAELGYNVQERVIEGGDYALETRRRMVMVAVTQGIEIDMDAMIAPARLVTCVGDILDEVADDDPRWSEMGYLKEKELRDAAAGKGFRMAVAKPCDTGVGTIGTGYQKNRSTEPKVPHPSKPGLLRLFSPGEHARIKGVPERLIEGIESATRAHQLLGQSVVWPAFRHVGQHIGQALLSRKEEATEPFALSAIA